MQFNPNEVTDQEFDLLPESVYRVMVNGSQLKANKNNDGSHVSVEFQIVDGAFKGRKLWYHFNVAHPNDKAQKIGRAQMKKFLGAIGVTNSIDLASQLPAVSKNKTLYVDVIHDKDFRDPSKIVERIKHFDASREPSTASKAVGAAYEAPGAPVAPSKLDDVPF